MHMNIQGVWLDDPSLENVVFATENAAMDKLEQKRAVLCESESLVNAW